MENVIDLNRLLIILRRNMILMVILGVVFGAAAFAVSKFVISPKYSASTALLVNRKDDQSNAAQYADQQADVQIINTYKDIITRPIILNAAIKRLQEPQTVVVSKAKDATYVTDSRTGQRIETSPAQPEETELKRAKYPDLNLTAAQLAGMVSISNQANSQVFTVTVTMNDAVMAKDLANSIAKEFKSKISDIMSVSNVSIVSSATTSYRPVSPNVKLITAAGILFGLLIGFVWGVIREMTDRTVKDIAFITDELGLTNLGVVSYVGRLRDLRTVVAENKELSFDPTITRANRRI
jgi:capsular polysaccharide biosynthesis protein